MKKILITLLAAVAIMSGCNKNETITNTTQGGPGKLSVKITDAPFNINSVESAEITISKVEIRKVGDADETFIELPMDPVTIDVFQLRNGLTDELVNLEVPQGDYDQVRLYVDEATLTLKDPAESFNMKVPSGAQTGIKVFISPVIHVEGGISAELVLDFDLANSFVMRGKDAHNGFIFKPVIRAVNNSIAGRIEGIVTDNSQVGIENATVTLLNGTTVTSTALTDVTGHYAFTALPPATYSLAATKENYETVNVDGIVVVAGNKTTQNFVLKSLPVYVSSSIENATPALLEMLYSLNLANILPDVSAFAVTVGGTARTVTTVAITDNKVQLTLSNPVVKGDVVTVAYTKPTSNPLQTADGLEAPTMAAQSVTNNVN
jgi:uncharacterized repeat protein (TIGR02059 family)